MQASPCPTEEQLAGYLAGASGREEGRAIGTHVECCPRCRQWLTDAEANEVVLPSLVEVLDQQPAEPAHRREPGAANDSEESLKAPSQDTPQATMDAIGGYRIVRELGYGGQGVVYEAVQKSTKRNVAIKVLLEGSYAAPSTRKRFEREIELVAGLRHANIVAVFDSGTTHSGRQFCVMDFVQGVPLDRYVRQTKPTLEETLELFGTLCDTVSYAHRKGVIHRDLKPSNVLVDAEGKPKVLDFGLAKQLAKPVDTLVTATQDVIGTLPYMSPEQARGNQHEVDTRTDIYSLGVILYELLTGAFPYPVTGQLAEVLRHITDTPPTPPSRKWSSNTGVTTRSAKRVRPGECPIDDELQTIINKALAKEPERRYQSADELRRDVDHYLSGETISARPPSVGYLLRVFARRHKGFVFGVASVFIVLLAGVIVSTSLYYHVAAAREAEAQQRQLAEAAQGEAEAERTQALRQAAIAQALNDFLNNDLLAAVAPEAEGRDVTVREVLDAAASRIEGRFENEPLIEAAIRATLGNTYHSLGAYEAGASHLEEAVKLRMEVLGKEHPETLLAVGDLGEAYQSQGRFDQAEALKTDTLEVRRRVLGDSHPDTLIAMNNLASLRYCRGRYDEAVELHSQTLTISRQVLGSEHPETLASLNNLAIVLQAQGRHDTAEPLLLEVVDTRRRKLGVEHPDTLNALNSLAVLYSDQGLHDQAEPVFAEILELQRRVLGEDHPDLLVSLNNLGMVYGHQSRHDEAEPLFLEALQLGSRTLGENHQQTLACMNNLAILYFGQKRHDEAEALHAKSLEISRKLLGDDHPDTLFALHNLAHVCATRAKYDQAEALFSEAVAGARRSLSDGHWHIGVFLRSHGSVLLKLGRYEEAETALTEAYEIFRDRLGADDTRAVRLVGQLIRLYESWNKVEQAAAWRAKLPAKARCDGGDPPTEVP